jgi:hypothetical protein
MATGKRKPVRDPLLPLTHYQRLGKQPAKPKSPIAIWTTITLVVFLVLAGLFFLNREIEALKQETDTTLHPTIAEQDETFVTPASASPSAAEVTTIPTSTPSVIPTMPIRSTEAPAPTRDMTMCTMDAMQCPDGSWVGRSGPACEFKCPTQ